MPKGNLLIVEDNEDLCQSLADVFRRVDYDVKSAHSAKDALAILKKDLIDLVVLDLQLPDGYGLDVFDQIKEIDPDIVVIMITASIDVEPAVKAMKRGAFDYFTKPFENDQVRLVVSKALETQSLKREVSRLKRQQSNLNPDIEMYSRSPAMDQVKNLIKMVADTPRTPVLIEGESGTGKELVANAIHYCGARAEKPFVKINCAAIPEHLLESELFGHEKGAFTDAKVLKKGLFEMSHPGTIFLDEISSMQASLQPKILRILETQTFRRIGGTSDMQIDVRIVTASNQNLEELVKAGEFREDLLYRLKVMVIDLPPLRDRKEDIIPLAQIFLERNNKEFGKSINAISESATDLLLQYQWPGNVRELKNVLERAVILCRNSIIEPEHLPVELRGPENAVFDITTATANKTIETNGTPVSLADMERKHIELILTKCSGNKSRTARQLGISRSTLREKMKLYGIAG
ncbi:MAG: sigma-54-dependent transcriptional regulator [bacterium]